MTTGRSLLDRPLVASLVGGHAELDLPETSVQRLFVADTGIGLNSLWDGSTFETNDPRVIAQAVSWQRARARLMFLSGNLSTSIALDRNFSGSHGNFTQLGELESVAKRERDPSAVEALVEAMTDFISSTTLYEGCSICAVPPSPEKTWHLPTLLADGVARACRMADLSPRVRFRSPKPPIKDTPFPDRLPSLERAGLTIGGPVQGAVLLLDDKIQSGTTADFVGAALTASGAAKVHGLFCVKTWRDRDNTEPPGAKPG